MVEVLIQDRYRLDAELGRGGMGTIYRAYDTLLERPVAVKVLSHPSLAGQGHARLLREARAVAKLNHPNIVSVYDAGDFEGSPFIVMELVPGHSLYESSPDSLQTLIAIARQLCIALAHAHAHGILHRDLKPENVIVTPNGLVKLMDFGLARPTTSRLTIEGALTGTVFYLSPEQALGHKIDARADLYSLGVLLYELATGTLPFAGEDPLAVISQHLHSPVIPPREKKPEIPALLDKLILRLLNKQPGDRPASAEDVLQMLQDLEAGGKPARLNLYDQASEFPSAGGQAFVGRELELNRLNNFLARSMAGSGSAVFISGVAGRGKTALLCEFSRRAQMDYPHVVVALGKCIAHVGIGDPFLPFRDVFNLLCGDAEPPSLSGIRWADQPERISEILVMTVEALLEHGPDLIDVLVPGESLIKRIMRLAPHKEDWIERLQALVVRNQTGIQEVKQTYLFNQCTNVLKAVAEKKPLMLLLEDLNWGDSASITLLFHLARLIPDTRILIVGTYRPEEIAVHRGLESPGTSERHALASLLNEFRRQFGDIFINLDQATQNEDRRFIDAYLDVEDNLLGDEFRDALFRHTGGHALFTVELLREMKERGDLVRDEEGRWISGPNINWSALPARLSGVLAERISRLDGPLQEILSLASVEGEEFTVQVIAGVLGSGEFSVLRDLSQEIEKKHLLVRDRGERAIDNRWVSIYQFSNIALQRYLYQRLGTGERRLLHGQIANQLEKIYEGHLDEIAVAMAAHYSEVPDYEKTVKYLMLAAEVSQRKFAYMEMASHLQRALELVEESTDSGAKQLFAGVRSQILLAQLNSRLGRAYRGMGNLNQGRKYIWQALALLGELPINTPGRLIIGLLREIFGQARYRLFPKDLSFRRVDRERIDIVLETAYTYSLLAELYFYANETLPTIFVILRTLNLTERVGPSPELAEASAYAGVAAGLVAAHPLARAYNQRAENIVRSINNPRSFVRIAILTSLYQVGLGDWDEAREKLEHAADLCEQLGDKRQWGDCIINLANIELMVGDTSRSVDLFQSLVEETRRINNPLQQVWGLEGLANHALRRGETGEAVAFLKEALSLLSEQTDVISEIEVYGLIAKAYLRMGELRDSRLAADESARRIAQSSITAYSLFQGFVGVAEVYIGLWQTGADSSRGSSQDAAIQGLARWSCNRLDKYARIFPIGRPYSWLYRGRLSWLAGRRRRAHQSWRNGLRAAESLAMPYECGLAHYYIGDHLDPGDPLRSQHLANAVELFSKVGATFHLERARAALSNPEIPELVRS